MANQFEPRKSNALWFPSVVVCDYLLLVFLQRQPRYWAQRRINGLQPTNSTKSTCLKDICLMRCMKTKCYGCKINVGKISNWLSDWLTDQPTNWPTDRPNDWPFDRQTDFKNIQTDRETAGRQTVGLQKKKTDSVKWCVLNYYSQTSIKRPPIKRPPAIKRPLSNVPNYWSVKCCIQYLFSTATFLLSQV